MLKNFSTVRAAIAVVMLASSAMGAAHAAEVIVTPGNPLWTNPADENSGTGSSVITATMPRSGNGSLEMKGDRTRMFGLGNSYDSTNNLGLFDSLSRLTFDWAIAGASSNNYAADYTPALRVTVFDNGVRSELIWEGVYNGTYGNTDRDTWYSSGVNDLFYRNVRTGNQGVTFDGNGSQINQSLAAWEASNYYSNNAYISGFSVGVGGGASNQYLAFADNIAIDFAGTSNIYNFEVTDASGAVPEPASLALLGLGLVGMAAFGRKKQA